jgi:hypothetical protein
MTYCQHPANNTTREKSRDVDREIVGDPMSTPEGPDVAVGRVLAVLFRVAVFAIATIFALAVVEFIADETNAPEFCRPAHWMQTFNNRVLYPFFEAVGYGWVCACDIFELLQKGFEILCRWLPLRRFATAVHRVSQPVIDALLSPFNIVTGINNAYVSWVDSKFALATGTVQLCTVVVGVLGLIYVVQR